MDFSITYEDGIFRLVITGIVDASMYDHILKTLTTHEDWKPGSLLLWDLSNLNVEKITNSEIISICRDCGRYREAIGFARIAKVLTNNLIYGLNRVWDAHVEEEWYAEVSLFRSREAALEWLLNS